MSNNAATEDDLGNLHNKVAKVMTNALTQIETAQEQFDTLAEAAGQEPELIASIIDKRPEVSPALLSAMTKFLADNHITCNDAKGAASGLKDTLDQKRKRSARVAVANVIPFAAEE